MKRISRLSLRKAISGLGLVLAALVLPSIPAHAGSWSGPVYTMQVTDDQGYPWTWGPDAYFYSPYDPGPSYWGENGASAVVTATFTWSPDPNNPNDAPTPLYVRETANVDAMGNTSASADDGLGDAAIISGGEGGSSIDAVSHGSHLVNKGKDSPITITRTLSATCPMGIINQILYYAAVDSRAVSVGSSLGQTYHKGANDIPEANVRAGDDSITDDTVVPDPATGTAMTYSPYYSGSWSDDSNYKWACSLTSYSDAGVFNSSSLFGNKTIPPFSGVYDNPPATAGKSDTVTLTLTDGSDGTTGSNTATVKFHDPYENWQRDGSKTVQHPTLLNQNGAINRDGDWTDLGPMDNPSPAPLTQAIGRSWSFSKTQTGTIGGQASLGPAGIAAFQANESIAVGETSTATLSETTTFTAAPWTRIECYEAPFWEERHGTCDVYGSDGYQGTADWAGVYASNPLPLRPGQAVTYIYPH